MEPALDLPPGGLTPRPGGPFALDSAEIGLAAACLSLCSIAIAARTYTRAGIMKTFDSSDWSLILAGLFFAAFITAKLFANKYGQGQHHGDISDMYLGKTLATANIVEVMYGPTMFFSKYAVLKQIESIFYNHRHHKPAYKAIWALIWANLAFYFAITVAFIFACVPRAKIADPTLDGTCLDTLASIIATSAINVVSDVTILIVPVAAVFGLQMPLKTKLGAAAVFAVGIFACVTSIVRLYFTVLLVQSEDLTFAIEPVGAWAIVECTAVILVTCIPLFPRLVNHYCKRERGSSYELSDNVHSSNKTGPQHLKQGTSYFELKDGGTTPQPDDGSLERVRTGRG